MPANFRSLSWATLGYRSIFDFTALHPPPRYARLRLGVKIKDARKGPKSVRLLTCLPTPATLTAMFYYLHLLLLAPFYSLVSILLRRDQDREIPLLRQQLLILSRKLSRKPPYGRLEKLALLLAGLRLSKRRLAKAFLIVQPDTLLRWHRELVRRHWTFRQKRRPGRPPLTEEVQEWVLRLARENPHWGSKKIQGEMLKLGQSVSRSTVARLLRRQGLRPPQDHRRSPTWSQFLGQYKDFIWACDFFTVTTARLRTFYVLFFMELGRRRLLLFNVTEHPQAEWVVQQVRNLSVQHDHLPRFILTRNAGCAAYEEAVRGVFYETPPPPRPEAASSRSEGGIPNDRPHPLPPGSGWADQRLLPRGGVSDGNVWLMFAPASRVSRTHGSLAEVLLPSFILIPSRPNNPLRQ